VAHAAEGRLDGVLRALRGVSAGAEGGGDARQLAPVMCGRGGRRSADRRRGARQPSDKATRAISGPWGR
jgi:hypothetical protein